MASEGTPIPPCFEGRRFHALNAHLRRRFGGKVFKVSLDAGFTCPNRDGTAGQGGCIFCSADGSGEYAGRRAAPLDVQFREVTERMHQKWPQALYIAYFQAFTNTHAPVHLLRRRFEPVLSFPGVVGMAIATRPDCLPEAVLDYLASLNERTALWVELGLQTIHRETAQRINRCYPYAVYRDALDALRARGIGVCVHLINGLPGESLDDMRASVAALARQDIQGVKLHLLHLIEGAELARNWARYGGRLMDRDTYVSLVCDQLEMLPPKVVIHRLTGDGPRDILLGPQWSLKKWEVLNAIDRELNRRDSWQGKHAR